MQKDILLVVDMVSYEKGINKETIFQAIELALSKITEKHYNIIFCSKRTKNVDPIRVIIDRNTGDYKSYKVLEVIDDKSSLLHDTNNYISIKIAKKYNVNIQIGDLYDKEISSIPFCRIGVHQAKKIIFQKVREAECKNIVEKYSNKIGTLISGIVKRITRDNFFINIDYNIEAILPKKEVINQEIFKINSRVRAILITVDWFDKKFPKLVLSRRTNKLVEKLFNIEVPEISDGIIEIKNIVREPGIKSKIVVKTNDKSIDPIGACIGLRGSRVQAISYEMNRERIDIILWDENLYNFLKNIFFPVKIIAIDINKQEKNINIAVPEDVLASVIGKNGINIKLCSNLLKWNINILGIEEYNKYIKDINNKKKYSLISNLNINEDIYQILVKNNIHTIEDIISINHEKINQIDKNTLLELKKQAENIKNDIVGKKKSTICNNLSNLPNISANIISILNENNIFNIKDLAEQELDDIIDFFNKKDKDLIAKLIILSRKKLGLI